nr:immunoglobulin light chain junction region [Macaca mulatta]MOX81638.1 immunoglobulin light chain junction region [Macaca mulatta]MOX82506.1 immunoglobulin light chain junction region [Macaca mulatta]
DYYCSSYTDSNTFLF